MHKLEFLALKWSVTEKFHDYLYGSWFEVITDNNPLTYILTTAKLDATGQRWVASLGYYNFTIKYRSGKKNADVDGLSCRREGNTGECTVFPDVIKAVAMSVAATECPFIDSVYVSEASDSTPPFTDDISEQLLQTHGLTAKDWRKALLQDLSLSFVNKCLEAGLPVPSRRSLDQAVDAKYIKEWDKMLLSNGQNFLQLVLPPAFREDVFEALHDDLGHQGRDWTMSLIKQRFFWPGMDTYIKNKVASCECCNRRKLVQTEVSLSTLLLLHLWRLCVLITLPLKDPKGDLKKSW